MNKEIVIYMPEFVCQFLKKRIGESLDLEEGKGKCNWALISLKRQIKAILEVSSTINPVHRRKKLQKKNSTPFLFQNRKFSRVTEEQNNLIAQLVKNYVQHEIFFELLINDGKSLQKRIEELIVKYEMEERSVESIYRWIYYKKNNIKAA